jgi:hypothetical protein
MIKWLGFGILQYLVVFICLGLLLFCSCRYVHLPGIVLIIAGRFRSLDPPLRILTVLCSCRAAGSVLRGMGWN